MRKLLALLLISWVLQVSAQNRSLAPPNWDREAALAAATQQYQQPVVDELRALAFNDPQQFSEAFAALMADPQLSVPAREATLLAVARQLRGVPALGPAHPVVAQLLSYENKVLVPHEEAAGMGVPLYPIRAAMAGVLARWEHDGALAWARSGQQSAAWIDAFRSASPGYGLGLKRALGNAEPELLRQLLSQGLTLLKGEPALTGLIGHAALTLGDPEALAKVMTNGQGAGLVELARASRDVWSVDQQARLLASTKAAANSATGAMLDGVLSAAQQQTHREPVGKGGGAGTIEQWTEADGVLGLGYPVPIPVETQLPFDGFRAYASLNQRHQSLASESGLAQPVVVGQTHNSRDIWAYRMGDDDLLTRDLLPENAMLTQGGIHAREWQTPEVVTGIMEGLIANAGDGYFYDYLLDNTNIVLLPVLNVDGFTQTQRFPDTNWLRSDPSEMPNEPFPSPRDGRMRRKNMPDVDEVLSTFDDHLLGVDLNRNSPPYHNTNPIRSSSDERSLVYHGPTPHSEPESQAMLAAADLGPADQLRLFADVHSFSQVFYFARTSNVRLTNNVIGLLDVMSNHNVAQPDGTLYLFDRSTLTNLDAGFGLTNEYFTTELGIPAFGLEVEPSGGQSAFPDNPPGCGADYGGLNRNCHDGFILPESQIRRVREELSRTFAAAYYHQAGPPSVAAVRIIDQQSGALVFEAEWDPVSSTERTLFQQQLQPLALDRPYQLWIAHDRPMRWRVDGEVVPFPGQPTSTLQFDQSFAAVADNIDVNLDNPRWALTPGDAPGGYFRYQDDALMADMRLPATASNRSALPNTRAVTLSHSVIGMTGHPLDANPATPVGWGDGGWSFVEDINGNTGDVGGPDSSISFEVTPDPVAEPFLIQPATTAAWFDPANTGEGFLLEILPNNVAVMYWFTYTAGGEQAWYVSTGDVRGNQLLFPQLIATQGGVFGPDFDPDTVTREVVGSARFVYDSCNTGTMVYELPGRKGRLSLERLSQVDGLSCTTDAPATGTALATGSWFNEGQSGHGFVVEVLTGNQALVYWFSYDLEGRQAWFFGSGQVQDGTLVIDETFVTEGPRFGPGFDPDDLVLSPWGTLRLDLGCDSGEVRYDGSPGGFPAATLNLSRLTVPAGIGC